jgi:hypothetical protein
MVATMPCSDWGDIWTAAAGDEIDDEGEQEEVRKEWRTLCELQTSVCNGEQ